MIIWRLFYILEPIVDTFSARVCWQPVVDTFSARVCWQPVVDTFSDRVCWQPLVDTFSARVCWLPRYNWGNKLGHVLVQIATLSAVWEINKVKQAESKRYNQWCGSWNNLIRLQTILSTLQLRNWNKTLQYKRNLKASLDEKSFEKNQFFRLQKWWFSHICWQHNFQ